METSGIKKNELSRSERIKAITGGSLGNLVEWYDWYAYTAFAIYFSPAFFPKSNLTAQLLNTAGIFAVGFLMRPIGGWLFGKMADLKGRKVSMTVSVLLMSFGSLLIACTPTYASIGIAAPALLFLARIIQGLSVGGEYGTSATYLSEMADKSNRGFYSSFQYVTLIGGQLLALGIQLILQKLLLSDAQLKSWGWRIPFFIGALFSIIAFYIRSRLEEPAEFQNSRKENKSPNLLKELFKYPRSILTVAGLTLGGTIAFYSYSIYMQKFLINTVHLTINQSTLISFITLLIFAAVQPFVGMFSDKVGRKPLLIAFGIGGTLFTIPIFYGLTQTHNLVTIFLLIMGGLILVSFYTSINAVVKAELFPAKIRGLGVGFPYAITTALFGGTAEYIALWFKKEGHEFYFYWYVTICIFISLIVYCTMRDTKKHSYIQ
jgi:MHS family alpha-ketoglutarate permease-like MFS transporter